MTEWQLSFGVVLALPQEGAMTSEAHGPNQISGHLHPLIYKAIVAFLAWMIIAAWGFVGKGYGTIWFTVVAGFAVIFTLVPISLLRLWRRDHIKGSNPDSFRKWLIGDLQTWQARLPAKEAAINILTAPAAAAVGMTALALVFYLDSIGAI